VEWNKRAAKSSDRITVWRTLSALTLGTLLGGIGVLCSRWVNDSPLLCTVLQSAFSTMVLAVLAPIRPGDLTLETQSLQTCPGSEHSGAQEARDLCEQRAKAQWGFAA
jgi:hypothetical protein